MADREQQTKRALWVTFALVAGYLAIPNTAGAATFTTTITCTSVSVCGGAVTSAGTPAGGASVAAQFLGGLNNGMAFNATASNGAVIDSVAATLNVGGAAPLIGTPPPYVYGPLSSGQYVATFVVTWNDNANTSTSSTSSTSSSSTSSTSSTSSSSTSSTSSTTSTTTTTTLAPGPGNGPIAPRPEGGLDTGAGADAAAVRGAERVDVVTSRNATVQSTFWNGSSWSSWADLAKPGVGYKGDPTIVSWAPGRLDVFARGGDDKLWQRFSLDGGASWTDWIKPVGDNGTLASPPDASTRGPNTLDIWVQGTDGNIYQLWWDGVTWNGWLGQGKPTTPGVAAGSHPTAISRDGTRVDVFVRGGDNKLWQKTWSGFDWSSWVQPVTEGTLNSSPDATSWDTTNLVVFILGTDQHMYALPFGTGGWGSYVRLSTSSANFTDNPGVTSRGPSRFDAFGRGTDGILYQIWQ